MISKVVKIMSNQMYARCEVFQGTFDSEFYVVLGQVSAVVDRSNVKLDKPCAPNGKHVDGAVLVYVIQEAPSQMLVELPGQAVVGGLRTWVPKDFLAAA